MDAERNSHRDDGSTASTAVLVGDHLYVANVGDSRAVISKAGKGIFVCKSCALDENDVVDCLILNTVYGSVPGWKRVF